MSDESSGLREALEGLVATWRRASANVSHLFPVSVEVQVMGREAGIHADELEAAIAAHLAAPQPEGERVSSIPAQGRDNYGDRFNGYALAGVADDCKMLIKKFDGGMPMAPDLNRFADAIVERVLASDSTARMFSMFRSLKTEPALAIEEQSGKLVEKSPEGREKE